MKHSLRALTALSLAALLSAGCSSKYTQEVTTDQVSVQLARLTQQGGYDLITAAELKQRIDAGEEMVIVDTMPYEASYKKAHIPGAVNFVFDKKAQPAQNWEQTAASGSQADYQQLLGADKSKTIVVYCGFVKCGRSHNGAAWAVAMGYENVLRFPGGIFAWQGADYPVATVE